MRIIVGIWHPAHVHFFKNSIIEFKEKGHEVLICARPKEMTLKLLDSYSFDYELFPPHGRDMARKLTNVVSIERKLLSIYKRFKPDISMGILDMYNAHVSSIYSIPCLVFTDTEHASFVNRMTFPFATTIVTPSAYTLPIDSRKHVKYKGYHELAYLHSSYFTPNPGVLDDIGLTINDRYIILRFVSWQAGHDFSQHGIRDRIDLVRKLVQYGRIMITSEGPLPLALEQYQIEISPEKLHDLLYYATLYVGEGGTMASEAAVLGTHAIHISTTAKYCGIFDDLNHYGLLWTSENDEDTINKSKNLLKKNNLIELGHIKRKKLLQEKINVTAFITWFVENYPTSLVEMRINPDIQNIFIVR